MSFSGKQKKQALQEKREKDRLRAEQEAAKQKARAIAEEHARERQRHGDQTMTATNTIPTGDDEEDEEDGGIMPVRRRNIAASASAASAVVAAPLATGASSSDDEGGIVPVRRRIGAAAVVAPVAPVAAPPASVDSVSGPSVSSSSSSGSSVPQTLGASINSTNKLRTAFARESDEVIEARKAASRMTLQRREMSIDGGTPSEDYYANQPIAIPVRPDWTGLTPAQLEENEVKYFNHWLESIYSQYGESRLNHFEHNLEVWRQLWRVSERSDILLVVVDSRQPILNFPPSLYQYITHTLHKPMVLVLNKIDLIPTPVVQQWLDYFHHTYPKLYVVPFTSFPQERSETIDHLVKSKAKRGRGLTLLKPYGAAELLEACRKIVLDSSSLLHVSDEVRRSFSFDPTLLSGGSQAVEKVTDAYADADEYMKVTPEEEDEGGVRGGTSLSKELKQLGVLKNAKSSQRKKSNAERIRQANLSTSSDGDDGAATSKKSHSKSVRLGGSSVHEFGESGESDSDSDDDDSIVASNSAQYANVLGRLEDSRSGAGNVGIQGGEFITLGCLGQPNAGKSSLINAIAGKKIVSVSKTPGHTKYLQTLFLNPRTRLCDCPGLVFPAVDMPRAMQVIAGSFPIAQTREPYSAVQFLAERIPIETIYKLTPNNVQEHTTTTTNIDDEHQKQKPQTTPTVFAWSAWTLCESLAEKKGFFNRKGEADVYRAANFILREVLDGTITLFFTPPKRQ